MVKKSKTAQLEQKILSLEDKYKRVLADYQNQTKRHQSRQVEVIKFASESLLDKLLPIIDSLELAQKHLKDTGLQMIRDQFSRVLESEGVKEINSTKQKFNPEIMDCANLVSGPKNMVVNTLVKGYNYHDKVLRPAKVEVGDGTTDKK